MSWAGLGRADIAAVGVGGLAGATLRWLITRFPAEADWFEYAPNSSAAVAPFTYDPGIPFRTLLVNLLGCLLLGALTLLLTRNLTTGVRRIAVGAATGLCGSLTTFSAFAVEAANLLRNSPPGVRATDNYTLVTTGAPSWVVGLAYIMVSIVGGALAFWLGRTTATRLAVGVSP